MALSFSKSNCVNIMNHWHLRVVMKVKIRDELIKPKQISTIWKHYLTKIYQVRNVYLNSAL